MRYINKLKYNWVVIAISFFFVSCFSFWGIRTNTLKDGVTRVPSNERVYANKAKFDKQLLNIIDTSVIYEAYDKQRNKRWRLDNDPLTEWYDNIRFYPNGCFNNFTLNRETEDFPHNFDPQHNGLRGVYYLEDGKIHYNLFAAVTGMGNVGKITGTITVSGDTLYLSREKSGGYRKPYLYIYIKRKIPAEYLKFQADW